VKLAALAFVHLAERRIGDDLSDAAAQVGARHWQNLDPTARRSSRSGITMPPLPGCTESNRAVVS
jgi:hypothetical protein